MTNESIKSESTVLRSVDWQGCCPWLVLLRVFRVACGVQLLLLATVGAIGTTAGWRLADRIFLAERVDDPCAPSETTRRYLEKWPAERSAPGLPFETTRDTWLSRQLASAPADPIISLPYRMVMPFSRALDRRASWMTLAYALFAGVWTVAVWSLFGGMISRIAVMQLGRDERIDLWRAFEFGRAKWFAHFSGPMMPLVGVGLVAIPMAILGVVMRSNLGMILGGLAWGAVLAGACLMVLLMAALLFGWPLMWASISAEGTDGFDAISRAYAYSLQRPLHYVFYSVIVGLLGILGWGVVWAASESVIGMTYWGTSWGMGATRSADLVAHVAPQEPGATEPAIAGTPSGTYAVGTRLVGFWSGLLRSLASGYAYSYFWCAAAAVYLLLRRSVDATDLDEVHVDEETPEGFGLPKLKEETADVVQLPEDSELKPVEPLQSSPEPGGGESSD